MAVLRAQVILFPCDDSYTASEFRINCDFEPYSLAIVEGLHG